MPRRSKRKKPSTAAATPPLVAGYVWTNNNLACVYTWLDLTYLKENDEPFEQAGGVRICRLRFWNQTDAGARRVEAGQLATQLVKMFTGLNFAKYEADGDFAAAVSGLTEALTEGDRTLSDLARVVDDHFNFFGEVRV